MTLVNAILLGLITAGGLAIYLPRPFVVHKQKFTRKEFVEQHPEFSWIKSDYVIEFFVFMATILGFASGLYLLQTPLSLGLFSIVFAGLALYNGLLTAKTGICRVPYPRMPYRYVYENNLRRVGWGQVVFGFITIVVAIGLALYRGPL